MSNLPVFKTPGIGPYFVFIVRRPVGAAHIDKERFPVFFENPIRNVQEPGASGSTQKFPKGCVQKVALDFLNVYRKLANRLTSIDQVRDVSFPAEPTYLFHGLHET